MNKPFNNKIFQPIAVIGLGCWYPGAQNPKEFWENILARREQFRNMPDCRLPLAEYYDSNPQAPDKTYGKKAAVIDGYKFDWAGKKIPKSAYESTDLVHWLALDIATQALKDAGFNKESLPKEKTGVIVGNSVTGEFTRSNILRLRWPYVKKVFRNLAVSKGWSTEEIFSWEKEMETIYKSVFAPVTEDTLAGGLSNTIAGRIANFYDLHGGGYTVDGACSSSLLAIITAINSLNNNDLDLAIAGGVDISLDTFELIGFAKTNALTAKEMTVYDKAGSGFIPGEGSGFVILKRLDQAIEDGNKIYALVKGWGIASDGKGGITAPSASGQAYALRRAYEKAGYTPKDLDFIEGHGTGTTVGDKIELQGIGQTFKYFKDETIKTCGMTSLKSIIGHAKAAAGVGAFIKAVIAVNQRVLPPTANCQNPHDVFESSEGQMFYPIREGEIKNPEKPLRAGISAMGFGGINSHVTIESGSKVYEHLKSDLSEQALLNSKQDSEVFVFNADTLDNLISRLQNVSEIAQGISFAEVTDLAAKINIEANSDSKYRAGIIASRPDEILKSINLLIEKIKNSNFVSQKLLINDVIQKIWLYEGENTPKIGFLFPGQGSQQINMAKFLINRFDWAKDLATKYNNSFIELGFPNILNTIYFNIDQEKDKNSLQIRFQEISKTLIAQPAIILASLLWQEYLKRLGISPNAVVGHSLGELTAFYSAGVLDFESLINLVALRANAMNSVKEVGQMLSLNCDVETVKDLIEKVNNYVVIANINSPSQIIASGTKEGIAELIKLANDNQIITKLLPVSNAFHSKLMQSASLSIQNSNLKFTQRIIENNPTLFSAMQAQNLNTKKLDIKEYFSKQVISPVQFLQTMQEMKKECNVFLEVGSGAILSKLSQVINSELPALALEEKAGSFNTFNQTLVNLFCLGQKINWHEVYANRLIRPFVKAKDREFIVNPLERPLTTNTDQSFNEKINALEANYLNQEKTVLNANELTFSIQNSKSNIADSKNIGNLLIQIAAKRTGFNADSILLEHRVLDDLNLDSIKSAELVAEAVRELGLAGKIDPSNYANSTLLEIKEALENNLALTDSNDVNADHEDSTENSWVRAFITKKVLSPLDIKEMSQLNFEIDLKSSLQENTVKNIGNSENAVFYIPATNFNALNFPLEKRVKMLQQIASFDTKNLASLTILHSRDEVSSFFASIHLEKPNLKIRIIDIPETISQKKLNEIISNELFQKDIYLNVFYDHNFERFSEKSELLSENNVKPRHISLDNEDVVLVTGGAKGITAECVTEWAKNYKVKLALVGRTNIPQNPSEGEGISSTEKDALTLQQTEIINTINNLKENGLTAKYYACDVTNLTDLNKTIEQINQDLGQVTCLIHGAGTNIPRRAEQVSADEAVKEIAPKVKGLINLLTVFKNQKLKLIAALSSIIGVTGMPGNAWYAYSNTLLKNLIKEYKENHPKTETQVIAYSVWDEVGMGVRLGSVKNLAKLGISAIPKNEGVNYFNNLLASDPNNLEVIVTARLGGLDTWQPIIPAKPEASRFLEKTILFEPGVELKIRTHLSVERDLYLVDHNFKDSYLFPTVFGLEAMAQTVAYVLGKNKLETPIEIINIELERPIVVDPEKGLEIEIKAEVTKDNIIKTSISTEHSNFTLEHFKAEFDLTSTLTPPFERGLGGMSKALAIDPKTELYGSILFQGERFQRIQQVYNLTDKKTLFSSETKTDTENQKIAYAPEIATPFILGDPFFRDTMLQSIQLIVPQHICLPINIGNISINKFIETSNNNIDSLLNEKTDEFLLGNVYSYGKNDLFEIISDYKLNIIEIINERPSIEEILNPGTLYERKVADEIKKFSEILKIDEPIFSFKFISNINTLKKEMRHKYEDLMFQELLNKFSQKNSQLDISGLKLSWEASGKPIIINKNNNKSDLGISFSHKGDYLFGIIGEGEQGCDIEEYTQKSQNEWDNLLGNKNKIIIENLIKQRENLNNIYLNIWTSTEVIKKAFNIEVENLEIHKKYQDSLLLKHKIENSNILILNFPIKLNKELIISFIVEKNKATILNIPEHSKIEENVVTFQDIGPQGGNRYFNRFYLVFKDVNNLRRTTEFPIIAEWMGKLREVPMEPIAKDLIPLLTSGKYGLVTNYSEIQILGEAKPLEIVEGSVWTPRQWGKYYSSFDLAYDWKRLRRDGSFERIAKSKLTVTWAKITGHGQVEIAEWPDFMKGIIWEMAPKNNNPDNLEKLPQSFDNLVLGENLYKIDVSPEKNNPVIIHTFDTNLSNTNLIGNVYFSNYYSWQKILKDKLIFKISPDLLLGKGEEGELVGIEIKVDHLREAMPFDQIICRMYITEIYENALHLYFEYFREENNKLLTKLAVGNQKAYWMKKDSLNKLKPMQLPQKILDSLLMHVTSKKIHINNNSVIPISN